jgi:hypothetical protein
MIGRAFLTSLYASTMVSSLCFMMYAMVIVADRDTPAWQCTSTLAPLLRASSETTQGKHVTQYVDLKVTTINSTRLQVLYPQSEYSHVALDWLVMQIWKGRKRA